MTITLNSTLKAAQDSQSHHPILEIISKPMIPDIPFVGQYLTDETIDEQRSNTITHSSNRICLVYKFDTDKLKYVYTDTDRTFFNFVEIDKTSLGMGAYETTIEATLCELDDANIGIVFTTEDAGHVYLRRATVSPTGSVVTTALMTTYNKSNVYNVVSPFVLKLQDGTFLLVYLKGSQNQPTSSGTYTGTTNSEYEVYITDEGTETTAKFYWRKDGGAWSAKITCTGAPQLLAEGVNITFVPGTYYEGSTYRIAVTAAQTARAFITITANTENDDEVIIGSETYTYKTTLVGGGNPNEVVIDIYGREISLENLRCAITDTSFEGTGEGVRYGTGTTAHPDITAVRNDYQLTVTAKAAGAAGNSIAITVPGAKFTASEMSGGADAVIGNVIASVNSRIMKRTCPNADFSGWSAEFEITIGTIGAQEKEHVSLDQEIGGDVWLLFDNYDSWYYANCYYSISPDNGLSWGNAVALTSYDSAQAKGLHPMLVQKTLTQVYAVYHEESGALHIDSDSPGWPGGISSITGVHVYDGKIYALATYTSYGTKYFIAVIEVDITTWRITDSWNTTSIPAFHTVFANEHVWWGKNLSAGKYVVIATKDAPEIAVLNIDTDTIKQYFFVNWSKYGIIKNVNWESPYPSYPTRDVVATFIDEDNDRLYIVLKYEYAYERIIDIVYIDLTAELVPGSTYNVTTVWTNENYYSEEMLVGMDNGDFKVYPNSEIAILTAAQTVTAWVGMLTIFDAPTDGEWSVQKRYNGGYGYNLPYNGIRKCVYTGGIIYGTFPYNAVSQPERQGLCKIIVATNDFSYIEPVWSVQYDSYLMRDICLTDDGMLAITTYGHGITIFDPATSTWTQYSNDTVFGLTPDESDRFSPITFDPTSGLVITGVYYDPSHTWFGLVAFNRYGTLKQPKYKIGTYTTSWGFGSASNFVVGYLDFDVVVTLDPVDNGVYAFWTNQNAALDEMSIKWAKETPEFDLTPYVVKSVPVVIRRDIEAESPNILTFAVAKGHLFDPFNEISLWRNYVAKGHKLDVRMGEKISGADYWQEVGSFLITERSMITYERGKYPIMDIKAEDKRILWQESFIFATECYEGKTPEFILSDGLENLLGEDPVKIDIPVFENSTSLYHQWIEVYFYDIVKQICDRYGYFPKITVDDDFTCGKISNLNTVTHTYTNLDKILTYTPDDTFSDYTTRIIVTCEGRDFEERVFPEERVLFVTGTIGWWGCKQTRQEYYSENKEKMVKNPYLRVYEPISMDIFGGGLEAISIAETDPDNKYLIIYIEAEDMRPKLAAYVAAFVAAAEIPQHSISAVLMAAAFTMVIGIISSLYNYQIEVRGNPLGYVRRSWQADAIDTELEALTGKQIEKKIEEPLAYYINEAQDVANHEMLVLQLQRKRIKISKTAHLQDEEGDTIQVKHPYSGRSVKIFITTLTRSMKIAEGPDSDGHWTDEIEGWIV